jgi:carboxylesterase type B
MLHAQGPAHVYELPLLFGFNHATYVPSAAEMQLSGEMVSYWTQFAISGDPNSAGAVAWPQLAGASDDYLQLDSATMSGAGIRASFCDFWDGQ